MKKTIKSMTRTGVAVLLGFALVVPTVFAKQEVQPLVNPAGKTVAIPARAVEVAPHVFSLGSAFDKQSGEVVEGYMIVRPRANDKRPGGGGGGSDPASSCYGFLASGAKWKNVEPWMVNPTNTYGMSDASVFSILTNSIGKWESAANFNILGDGFASTAPLVADETTPDGLNEVYFGRLADNNTIGVTIVWGIFGGPVRNRRLVEWDQVYNTYFNWSDTGAPDKMDFESIATHELGHSVGLADLYTASCSEQTMYGYGSVGETKARSLEIGDITGISALY